MVFVGIAALALGSGGYRVQDEEPALWLTPEGKVLVRGKAVRPRLTEGATSVDTPFGMGLDLNGKHGGLLLPDLPALALSEAITVSVWINLRSYVKEGPGAQILFRGDDRSGLDPYTLVVHSDGTVVFALDDTQNNVDQVAAPIPLKRWVHVTASFDARLSEAKLWIDDRCVKTVPALHTPLMTLAKANAPGIGIGNVQNDKGPHNQPLDGTIADLRLYGSVLTPAEAGWRPFKG